MTRRRTTPRAWLARLRSATGRSSAGRASHFSLGFLTLGGFIAGIVFWGGFNTALEATNTETFCTGCHEMRDNVFAELKTTIHYTNRSGVRATCPDCHVPHDWTDKIARKMQASKEVWGKIFGTIDTREKFRRQAARAGPARMGAAQGQRLARMPQLPQLRVHGLHAAERRAPPNMHSSATCSPSEKTCIDCHKGIAHRLPDMTGVPGLAVGPRPRIAGGLH